MWDYFYTPLNKLRISNPMRCFEKNNMYIYFYIWNTKLFSGHDAFNNCLMAVWGTIEIKKMNVDEYCFIW